MTKHTALPIYCAVLMEKNSLSVVNIQQERMLKDSIP
jgi:hypothetical protein